MLSQSHPFNRNIKQTFLGVKAFNPFRILESQATQRCHNQFAGGVFFAVADQVATA
jgi:hypothetical protein